jgi:NADPH-dependent curcumin reductase CurA
MRNRRLVLRRRPAGAVTDDCFAAVDGDVPEPGPGEILVRTLWLAFEPAQRGWLNDVRSYVPPVAIGDVMRAWGIGEVIASNDAAIAVGDLVTAAIGWQEHALLRPAEPAHDVVVVPRDLDDPTLLLSAAGVTGLTAYFGMTDIGRPGWGDTVLVTAAAGATGSVAGQIARICGAARVIGTAGSESKQAWVREVAGFDVCVSHHDPAVRRALRSVAPDGLDVVFDNVGGPLLDAALVNIAEWGRIVLCGAISTGYRPEKPEHGLHYYQVLTTRRARMEGFLVSDYADRFAAARTEILGWVADGRLRVAVDVIDGLERAPEGLRGLFEGRNLGKQLLRVADRTTAPPPTGTALDRAGAR